MGDLKVAVPDLAGAIKDLRRYGYGVGFPGTGVAAAAELGRLAAGGATTVEDVVTLDSSQPGDAGRFARNLTGPQIVRLSQAVARSDQLSQPQSTRLHQIRVPQHSWGFDNGTAQSGLDFVPLMRGGC